MDERPMPVEPTPTRVELLRYYPDVETMADVYPDAGPWDVALDRWRADRIARWEDEPFDPEDDLSIIAAYPREVRRLRDDQRIIAAHPLYKVAVRCGEEYRQRFLRDAIITGFGAGPMIDESAAEDFFQMVVCECELIGRSEFDDGSPIYRGHRDAARCRWCVLRVALEEQQHAEIAASAWACTVEEAKQRSKAANRELAACDPSYTPYWWSP